MFKLSESQASVPSFFWANTHIVTIILQASLKFYLPEGAGRRATTQALVIQTQLYS
jgi:hypothetical protein